MKRKQVNNTHAACSTVVSLPLTLVHHRTATDRLEAMLYQRAPPDDDAQPFLVTLSVYQRHAGMLVAGQPAVPRGVGAVVLDGRGPGRKRHENRQNPCHIRYEFVWCALVATLGHADSPPPPGLTGANRAAWDASPAEPRGVCLGLLYLGRRRPAAEILAGSRGTPDDKMMLEWVTGPWAHEVLFALPLAEPFQARAVQGDVKRASAQLLADVRAYFRPT